MAEGKGDDPAGAAFEVPVAALRTACDPAGFAFSTTAEIEPLEGFLGQERALEAIGFGTEMERPGFNLFVLGTPGSGRHTAISEYLARLARDRPVPADWVYVNDFEDPQRPKAISLPIGRAAELRDMMTASVRELAEALPAVFDTDEYRRRRRTIDEAVEAAQEKVFETLGSKAGEHGIAVIRTPLGFALAPMKDGQVVKPEVFNAWSLEDKHRVQVAISKLEEDLRHVLETIPRLDRDRRRQVRELDREFAGIAVDQALDEVKAAFAGLEEVEAHLTAVRDDMVENAALFTAAGADGETPAPKRPDATALRRYMVNVVVSNPKELNAAPVVREDNPTLSNLVGRVEHLQQMGALVTDFMLIKAGALHRANGGYLLIDARRVLTEPLAWEALKRVMRNGRIVVESLADHLNLISTVSLQPEPIPFSAKIVLFGERIVYYLLCELDPDFPDVFKVAVDFDDEVERDPKGVETFARLIAAMVRREGLLPFERGGVARVVEHASRLAEDARRLSVRLGPIADLVREADHLAKADGSPSIAAAHVAKAEKRRIRRLDRLKDKSLETIDRAIQLIETSGARIGQVNGLSVLSLGAFAFGRPSRITARVRLGAGRVVDIERETELGGPIHSKGVLILSGLLAARFAPDWPVSLQASLVFEQSYSGVEGDSASAAEYCALISAIAERPLRQDLAITGSLNQFGQIQAIGGVNEKIEGFFEVCKARGLSGTQGVLIPRSNVQHLMLDDEVVEACRAGRFRILAVNHVDEALALLTGLEAGARGADGAFPDNTLNRLVEDQLIAMARRRIALGRLAGDGGSEAGGAADKERP